VCTLSFDLLHKSFFSLDHIPKNDETADTSNILLDELINTIQTKNNHLKEHLNQENKAIDDLICKKLVY
jgi:hypothetical protein